MRRLMLVSTAYAHDARRTHRASRATRAGYLARSCCRAPKRARSGAQSRQQRVNRRVNRSVVQLIANAAAAVFLVVTGARAGGAWAWL